MRRSKVLVILFCVMCLTFLFSCNNGAEDDNVYSFEGIADIHISHLETQYDFKKNVTAFKNLEETDYSVDHSGVVFGSPGEYEVKYIIDEYWESAKVYIYGEPTFTSSSNELSYADVQTKEGLKKGLTARDTFGNTLPINVTNSVPLGNLGFIEYGEYTITYTAEDSVGNVKTYSRTITVSQQNRPVFSDLTVDLVDPEEPLFISGSNLEGVTAIELFFGGQRVDSSDYISSNGMIIFTEDYILSKDLGTYTFTAVCSKGYNTLKLEITDNQPALFNLDVKDLEYSSQVTVPKAVLVSNQRNISFEYSLKDFEGRTVTFTETSEGIVFEANDSMVFTLTAFAKRGSLDAGSKEVTFKVHDNLYLFAVDKDNELTKINPDEGTQAEYTAERKYGTDLGSTHLKKTVANSGYMGLQLKNAGNVSGIPALEFYVYNPTGKALTTYIYTRNGYWETYNNLGGVLTEMVTIPATEGWHKVVLNFKAGFDGTLDTITKGNEYTEIRITSADWTWNTQQDGVFEVYISNIYKVLPLSSYEIDYGLNGYVAKGATENPVSLPHASSSDGRISFEYVLTFDGAEVEFDEENLTFVPEFVGEYQLTINALFRGKQLDSRTITIDIEDGSFALIVADYYTFDDAGMVALPAATISLTHADKTIRYIVKTDENDEGTVLEANRQYNCGKQAGTYLYIAELMDGDNVVASITKEVNIHGANVLAEFGRNSSSVGEHLRVTSGTTFTYTTEKAAPGELGSLKINNEGFNERGNFNIQLAHTNIANCTLITFYIYHTANVNLEFRIYSPTSWFVIDYWYEGQRYTDWDQYPVTPYEGWQKIEIVTGSKNISGNDIRLVIGTDGYAWPDGEPAEIYISNIYYN